MPWVDFEYREFHDVPRSIVVRLPGGMVLLESRFDESIDDYDDHYAIFRLARDADPFTSSEATGSPIGRVAVSAVKFDESKRRQIDLDCLRDMLPESILTP